MDLEEYSQIARHQWKYGNYVPLQWKIFLQWKYGNENMHFILWMFLNISFVSVLYIFEDNTVWNMTKSE
jgi:hypothetical protein